MEGPGVAVVDEFPPVEVNSLHSSSATFCVIAGGNSQGLEPLKQRLQAGLFSSH